MFRLERAKEARAEVLVTGLPGIGRVGHVAAAYIVTQLDLSPIATLYSDFFPPQVVIEENGRIRPMRNLFFYVEAERPFILLTGDTQVVGSTVSEHYAYARELLRIAKEFGVKEIYTMAGIDRGPHRLTIEPGVVAAVTDDEIAERLKPLGVKIDTGGAISGAAGLLLGLGMLEGMRGACLMGETSSQLTAHGDPAAAHAVLSVVSKLLGLDIDLSELKKAGEHLNTMLRRMLSPPKQEKREERLDYIR